jgi:peptide/nickel transport system permease protein
MAGIVRRFAHVVVVLLLVTFAVTFMVDLTPGDPAYAVLGEQATPEQVARVHAELHLDDPVSVRYWHWLTGALSGDFGSSLRTHQSVLDAIGERLPVTLEVVALALLLALAVAVPLGVRTAHRENGPLDRLWSAGSSTLVSLPVFVTGLLLVYVFALQLRHTGMRFPATGWAAPGDGLQLNLWHAFLPALTLALAEVPVYARQLRADMISTLHTDFVLNARAKGMSTSWILFRHAFRPSSLSLVTLSGLSIGRLISGAVVVEMLFSVPGVGQLLVLSVQAKDVALVQGVVCLVAIGYVLVNSVMDLVYGALDPRVRIRTA